MHDHSDKQHTYTHCSSFRFSQKRFYLIINGRKLLCLLIKNSLENGIHYNHSYQFHFMFASLAHQLHIQHTWFIYIGGNRIWCIKIHIGEWLGRRKAASNANRWVCVHCVHVCVCKMCSSHKVFSFSFAFSMISNGVKQ